MVEAGQRKEDEALVGLYALLEPDIRRVLCVILRNQSHLDDAMQDVRVRIFVYLSRFKFPAEASEQECRELLRRWATNLARNWARLVNTYGLTEVQSRYILPQWSTGKGEPLRRRQPIVKTASTERDFEEFEEEGSEYTLEHLAYRALESGRAVSI